MEFLKNKNFAHSILGGGITDTATTLNVKTGDNIYFPSTGSFMCVIWGQSYSNPASDNSREIIKMTHDTGDTYTIVREQEDTIGKAWDVNSNIASTFTAGKVDEIETEINTLINNQNYSDSPMIISGGLLDVGTNTNTFKVSELTALLRETNSSIAQLKYVTKTLEDNITITSIDTLYYVILNYNSGTPTISISETLPNMTQNILIGKVMRHEYDIYFCSVGLRLQDGVRKLFKRAYDLRKNELISGSGTLSYKATDCIGVNVAFGYLGANEIELPALDTSGTDTYIPIWGDGAGGFVEGAKITGTDIAFVDGGAGTDSITQTAAKFLDNNYETGDKLTISGSTSNDQTIDIGVVTAGSITLPTGSLVEESAGASVTLTIEKHKICYSKYDNDGVLTDLGVSKFGCHWWYRHISGKLYCVLGVDNYSEAEASVAPEPNRPDHLAEFGTLFGVVVAPQTGGSFSSILMVTENVFSGTAVAVHNSLGGLNDGDYKHLTASEYTESGFSLQTETGIIGTTDIDWSDGNFHKFTFGAGNETLTFTNPSLIGDLTLILIQDSTGSRTITWPTVLWEGGVAPTLTTTANAIDVIKFIYDGTNYYGRYFLNNS
jgi:hypothetical protein